MIWSLPTSSASPYDTLCSEFLKHSQTQSCSPIGLWTFGLSARIYTGFLRNRLFLKIPVKVTFKGFSFNTLSEVDTPPLSLYYCTSFFSFLIFIPICNFLFSCPLVYHLSSSIGYKFHESRDDVCLTISGRLSLYTA